MFVVVVVSISVALVSASHPWQQNTNASVYQLTKLVGRTAAKGEEKLLVSCGQGCYGHISYLSFAVIDAASGAYESSFPHCNNAPDGASWCSNTHPICGGTDNRFALITHFNGTGAQVALTSVTNEPQCEGTLIAFPPNVAYMYNAPCVNGAMVVFAPVPVENNTYAYQVDVNAGTVANITIPDVQGWSIFSVTIDNTGDSDTFVAVGSLNNTDSVMLCLFSLTRGLLASLPYSLIDGATPTYITRDNMAYLVVPVAASPAIVIALDTVLRRPVWNVSLAVLHAGSSWLGPYWSDACGLVVVHGAVVCLNGTGHRVWTSDRFGETTVAMVHPTTGAVLVGAVGYGLFALNPYTGSIMWKESGVSLTNITGAILLVQSNQMAITQRFDQDGTTVLVGVPLNISMPTPAPKTPSPSSKAHRH